MSDLANQAGWLTDSANKWMQDVISDNLIPNWQIPHNVYLTVLSIIVLIYTIRNLGSILVHAKQLAGAIIGLVGILLSPITGDRISKFSAKLFDDINFKDHIKNNTVDDFVVKAISGVDGIDGKIGQSMALLGLKGAIIKMKEEGELFTRIGEGENSKEVDLEAFNSVIDVYLEEYNESYKTLSETVESVKGALKIQMKDSVKEVTTPAKEVTTPASS